MKKAFLFKTALIIFILILAAPALAEEHAQKRGTPAQAQRAIALFGKTGAKAAFDRFTNRPDAEFKHLDLYIFVLKAEEGARIVAHA